MNKAYAPAGRWLAGVAAPVALVVVSVLLLGVLAVATVLDSMSENERYSFFAAGVACWIAGVGSSVVANGGRVHRAPWR